MPKPVALVACCKSKLDRPAPAKELYTGQLFRASRAYVEAQGWPWFVLSAKYGLVSPDTVIEPYESYLADMPAEDRRIWAWYLFRDVKAMRQAGSFPPTPAVVCMLAGQHYRHYLAEELRGEGYLVEEPLAHLGIGQQIAWLKYATEELRA
jgi:hypothetical protein